MNSSTAVVSPSPWAPHSKVAAIFPALIGFARVKKLFTAGSLPIVANGKISADVSASTEFTWGEKLSFSKSYVMSFTVNTTPGKIVTMVSTVERGVIEVPYTIYLSSKRTGAKAETEGMWRSDSTWDVSHTFSEV